MITELLKIIVAVIVVIYMVNQVRKPTRWVGQFFLWGMNRSHSRLTDWGLTHVQIEKPFTILDVGCGGGRTLQKLVALATEGRVEGIDYSAGSVAASRAQNATQIAAGRADVRRASVSQLPFPEDTFDLVTAVETHYYWPDLEGDAREILRVTKPGGALLVIAETYKGNGHGPVEGLVIKSLRGAHMTVYEHRAWLAAAGFSDVQVDEERSKGWICVTGRKPWPGRGGGGQALTQAVVTPS